MMREQLEDFLARIKSKSHVFEILPAYSMSCCLSTGEKSYFFILSKSRAEMVDEMHSSDIKIIASCETIENLFSGNEKLISPRIQFQGSFRQLLLMDSLFRLVKQDITKKVS